MLTVSNDVGWGGLWWRLPDWLTTELQISRREEEATQTECGPQPPPTSSRYREGNRWLLGTRRTGWLGQRKYYRGNITEQNTSQQEFLYHYISFYFHFYRYQNRAEEKPWLAPIKIQNIFIIKNIFFLLEKSKVWQASPLPPSKAARRQPIYSIFRLNVLKW